MLKSIIRAFVGALLAVVAMSSAFAALPDIVQNATGTVVYGAHQALAVKKDLGNARTAVLYQSGWQYVADDAAWSKYAKLVTAVGNRGLLVDNDPDGTVIVVSESNGVYCQSNQSLIAFPNYGQAYTIADGCNFWTKVKANAN